MNHADVLLEIIFPRIEPPSRTLLFSTRCLLIGQMQGHFFVDHFLVYDAQAEFLCAHTLVQQQPIFHQTMHYSLQERQDGPTDHIRLPVYLEETFLIVVSVYLLSSSSILSLSASFDASPESLS